MRTYFVFIISFVFSLNCFTQGLQFQGHGVLIENRPSYSVFESEIPTFDNQFTIHFDISFHDINPFGYIFSLTDNNSKKEYNLIYTDKDDDNSLFKFNTEGKNNILSVAMERSRLDNRSWINIACTFYPEGDSMLMRIDEQKYSANNIGLPKPFNPILVFGKNKNSVDIPSFSIRNLTIWDKKQRYTFPLNESSGSDVHGADGNVVGHISNPVWMINNSYYWKSRFTYQSKLVSGVNYDKEKREIVIFNKDSLAAYNINTNKYSVNGYSNSFPLSNMRLGMSYFDDQNHLYAYEVWPRIDTTVAYLDKDKMEWKSRLSKSPSMPLHHHAGYYDPQNKEYIVFGGFGNQRYSDKFFSYKIDKEKWDTLPFSGDKISPRFYQGIVHEDKTNSLYIFGGIGNESGDQTIGRHYLYDLYKADLNGRSVKKLWTLDWTAKNVVPARNLVMLDDSHFYALCYPEYEPSSYVQLYEFSISDGSYRILGDSIPFRSDKITTNVNLFYDDHLAEFYCIIQEFEDNGSSAIQLYSLSSPPISKAELAIYGEDNSSHGRTFLILLLTIFAIGCIYVLYRKTKLKTQKQTDTIVDDNIPMPTKDSSPDVSNSIYLFGEFTMYDRRGKDITYMLSTRLRYTFLIMLQYSIIDDGITSHQLNELLWPDKDEYSVKNLRGVTISQLRKVISELDDIELIYEKSNFKLIISNGCYCDCSHILQLIDSENNSIDKLNEIKEILSRGQFLKSSNETLTNSFKTFVEERIVSILPVYIEEALENENYLLATHLSENLLIIDPLNETTFALQIKSLYKLKQVSEAKKQYAIFTSRYQKTTNSKYPISFTSLCNI